MIPLNSTRADSEPINQQAAPLLGCIADDVTGATDLALNLVQGGMKVVQILGIPDSRKLAVAHGFDAVVVALKSRSIPVSDAVDQSLATLRSLKETGVQRTYFKYCSTFDSTDRGNIGPVAEALMSELGSQSTIYCPAFPDAGRTVYCGHLFVNGSLLSESGMQSHPLNPMTDPNLVRFLSKQVKQSVGLISHELIDSGAADIDLQIAKMQDNGAVHFIIDACHNKHLATIAQVAANMPLVTGGSGLAKYLPAVYRKKGMLHSEEFSAELPAADGRSAILSGSCSKATSAQVEWMSQRCPTWRLDVPAVLADADQQLNAFQSWCRTVDESAPLMVASTAEADEVARLQDEFGIETVARSIENFLAAVSSFLTAELNVRRLVLAGGETSGAILKQLNVQSLRIGPQICPGVPWTETVGTEPPLALALKSGNFGKEDFFGHALEMLK